MLTEIKTLKYLKYCNRNNNQVKQKVKFITLQKKNSHEY